MEGTNESTFPTLPDVSDAMPTIYPYHFPPQTHVIVASYLVVIGILGTLGNTVILATFLRFRALVTPTTLLLINLAISDLGLIVFGFPFSASSSYHGRWIFGAGGCQWYAFTGFLFGSAHIGTLTYLAIDRYLITCRLGLRSKLTYRRYGQMLSTVWAYALFWASMPLLGWGRYGPEPSVTTCTIDWQHNDASYKSFIMVYFVMGYVLPLIIIATCYFATARHARRHAPPPKTRREKNDEWANERSMTTMSVILVMAFIAAWTPYAVVCLWPVFHDPLSMPSFMTLLPPLVAKASTVINPVIYYLTNSRLRAGILATIFCACSSAPPEIMEFSDATEKAPVASAAI